MEFNKSLLVLSLMVAASFAAKAFEGEQVFTITPNTKEQLALLQNLEKSSEVDFWTHPFRVDQQINVRIAAAHLHEAKEFLTSNGIHFSVKIADLQKVLNAEKDVRASPFGSKLRTPDVLTRYGTQPEIAAWLEVIASECGSRCTLMPFGVSVEGREMKVIKITSGSSTNKPAVFVDGGIHAREWISPAFVNNMIHKFVTEYGIDREVNEMLDNYDWYILPLLNPDGYQYSHDSDRMWRKNRATNNGIECMGVDLNRNFGYRFGGEGTSDNPCSEIYHGGEAFSEPESEALKDFLERIIDLEVYLTFHSYGQYILFPWGYAAVDAPNHDDLMEVGNAAANAITNGRRWRIGNAAKLLYPSAGASDDYAYSIGALYSYCIELPPRNGNGFILPESEIPGVVSSVWNGVKAMIQTITEKEQLKQNKMRPHLRMPRKLQEKVMKNPQANWKPEYL